MSKHQVTPTILKEYWMTYVDHCDIITLSDNVEENSDLYPNKIWYDGEQIAFNIPDWCGIYANNTVIRDSFEQILFLCKASLIGDKGSFLKIIDSKKAAVSRFYGNNIKIKNEEEWLNNICRIVLEIIRVKYKSSVKLSQNLLASGDKLIVRSSEYDLILGNGLTTYSPYNKIPNRWPGLNVLGWALMVIREEIKQEKKYNINDNIYYNLV